MEPTTVDHYLKYIPVGVTKSEYFASSEKTTTPSTPRGVEGVEVCVWESFKSETVDPGCQTALKWHSDEMLVPLYESKFEVDTCENECQVENALRDRLFLPLMRLMHHVGFPGKFLGKPAGVILDPDYSWSSKMVKTSPPDITTASGRILVVKIAIEIKTFWAFDPPDDLVAMSKDRTSMGGKVTRAVSQIYGYMSINHLRYGVLGTFDKFLFLRRRNGEDDVCNKLEITRVIRRDQTRDSDGFTLMEAWLGLVMAAEHDHVFTSPFSSPPHKQQQMRFLIKNQMELNETAKIANLYFGERKTRSQLGIVVKGGIRGNDEKTSVMKIVDTSKSSDKSKKLDFEVSAYRELEALHGKIVPKVRGFLLIGGWIKVLVLPDCGEEITNEQFVKHFHGIRGMVKTIHAAGVAHGDLADRNILVDTKEKLTIIDFSDAKLRKDCTEEEFAGHCKQDFVDLEKLANKAGRTEEKRVSG